MILIGNLGRDPEVRSLESGTRVAKITLATTESFKNKEGNREERTEWHNVTLWRGLAEVADKYLKKGMQVYIEGRLRTRKYEKDGQTKYITEVEADNMTMLGGKREGSADEPIQQESNEAPRAPENDDLPF